MTALEALDKFSTLDDQLISLKRAIDYLIMDRNFRSVVVMLEKIYVEKVNEHQDISEKLRAINL